MTTPKVKSLIITYIDLSLTQTIGNIVLVQTTLDTLPHAFPHGMNINDDYWYFLGMYSDWLHPLLLAWLSCIVICKPSLSTHVVVSTSDARAMLGMEGKSVMSNISLMHLRHWYLQLLIHRCVQEVSTCAILQRCWLILVFSTDNWQWDTCQTNHNDKFSLAWSRDMSRQKTSHLMSINRQHYATDKQSMRASVMQVGS